MENSPGSDRIAARSSMIDQIWGCTAGGPRISKEELKYKITMPLHLRLAMRDAVLAKDVNAGICNFDADADPVEAPQAPLVVFINSRSGGRHGPELKGRLQELMSEEQIISRDIQPNKPGGETFLCTLFDTVFDLQTVRPHEFVKYALGCLEKLADHGDRCAKVTRKKLRVVVAGGDGTVGWVLGCLGDLHKQGRNPVPPTGIMPLGTGNDLSRTFGWGGSFPFNWKPYTKRALDRVINGPICRLDSWNLLISMPAGEPMETPHCLKPTEDCSLDEGLAVEGELPEKVSCYEGVFYNYFSIGMDAQVAYGFHHLRNEKPYLAQGPIANKIIYSGYSCKQGWFFTPCIADPSLRGLKNILRMHVKKINSSKWEQVPVPSSVRAIVALNLHNYGSGRNPWGNLKPEYMEKKGFVEAQADDGLLEVFGLKQGWHASFVMVELISAKHIAQASAIRFEFRGGEWREAFMQVDGEPWKQPMDKDYSTFLEIKRVPFQSVMISGD